MTAPRPEPCALRSALGDVMLTARASAMQVLDAPAIGGAPSADVATLRRLPAALAFLTPASAQEALFALAVARDALDPTGGQPDTDSTGSAVAIIDRLARWLIAEMGAEPAAPEVNLFCVEWVRYRRPSVSTFFDRTERNA